jgi:hypothetical protein
MTNQFDLFAGMALRDKGMEQVFANSGEWKDIAYEYLVKLTPRYVDLTGESIKVLIMNAGCPQPHHCNAWGPLIKKATSNGVLRFTGTYRLARTKKRHASVVRVYRRV